MIPFFNNEERIMKLVFVTGLWLNTPWAANSSAKGCGVSCHNLPISIYQECGALPVDFKRVTGDPSKDKHATESRMEKYLESSKEFSRVVGEPMPGDMVGIKIYRNVDHLGVVLPNNTFVHVLMHKNTCIDLMVSPWLERMKSFWRLHE